MEYVRLEEVHKSFWRRYGAPTLRAQQERADLNQVDHALRSVSMTVDAGEAVAVLGRPRSGRSTLLSVIAGVYRPDAGRVYVRGRATGLTAMGAGFSLMVPVRANIELSAALLGMRKQQVQECLDEILDFAGLARAALDYPFREISGAQRRRVGYALVMASRPEVFLADGIVVMGKGDQLERCYRDLEAMRDAGHALLLASNSKAVTRRLCSRGVVLDHGEVVFDGPPRKALRELRALRRGGGGDKGDGGAAV
jgi:ABC-2 type transport system ATP-binding protein